MHIGIKPIQVCLLIYCLGGFEIHVCILVIDQLSLIYDKNGSKDNMLVVKDHITYADIVMVSLLDSIYILAPEAWERVKVRNDGRWEKLRETFRQWRVFS